jgi:hypothetical protein
MLDNIHEQLFQRNNLGVEHQYTVENYILSIREIEQMVDFAHANRLDPFVGLDEPADASDGSIRAQPANATGGSIRTPQTARRSVPLRFHGGVAIPPRGIVQITSRGRSRVLPGGSDPTRRNAENHTQPRQRGNAVNGVLPDNADLHEDGGLRAFGEDYEHEVLFQEPDTARLRFRQRRPRALHLSNRFPRPPRH